VSGLRSGAALDCGSPGRVGRRPGTLLSATRAHPLLSDQSDPAIDEELVSAEALQRRVRELGAEISRDYQDGATPLLLVGVLKGAVFFLSDLMRWITVPVEIDFMAVASYGSATDSSGVVRILKDLDAAIEGRDVLIVEDIVDSGLTLQYLLRNLGSRNPSSLEVCALLTKPERRKVDLPTRYVGFEIPTSSPSATDSTMPSAIATSRMSRRSVRDPRARTAGAGRGAPERSWYARRLVVPPFVADAGGVAFS